MIYFVQRANGDIKIGLTDNLYIRLPQLESKYGKLEILGLMPGGLEQEKQLHRTFYNFRVTKNGEWFFSNPHLDRFIEKNTAIEMPARKSPAPIIRMSATAKDFLERYIARERLEHGDNLTHAQSLSEIFQRCEPKIWAESIRRSQTAKETDTPHPDA